MAAPASVPDLRAPGVLARRLRSRLRRGYSGLLDLMLALVLFSIVALGLNAWLEIESAHGRARASGQTVAVLADAARYHVQAHYHTLIGGAPRTVSRGALAADRILPDNFVFADAMKRDLAVLVLPDTDGVRVLSGQTPGPGDDRRPSAGLVEGVADQRLGMVTRTRCPSGVTAPCLLGPGVADSVAGFDTGFPGRVREGAIMALYEYDHEDYCGAFLHRVDTGICPGANRMGQDVQVTGRLTNAALIERVNHLVVHGALTVGRELEVTGTLTSEGRMTVGAGARITSLARVDGQYGSGAQNPACQDPTVPFAVCNEDRVIVGQSLTVRPGTTDVLGRPGRPDTGDTDAGDVRTGCLEVTGRADVEGRVRVTGGWSTPAGSCP